MHFANHQIPYMPALDNWHKAFSEAIYYRKGILWILSTIEKQKKIFQ